MRLGRALLLVCGLASGCDRLFALTHVPDPPVDAYEPDAAPPCPVRDIGIGQHHACAIDMAGDLYCWGSNEEGQVQPGAGTRVLVPMKISLPGPATDVVLGKEDTCAHVGTDVYCWGNNDRGQLGKGSSDTSKVARKIDGIPPSAEVAVGGGHICSRSTDGTIWCWGRNRFAQTGLTSGVQTCNSEPCTLPGEVTDAAGAKRIVAGHNSTCIIDASDQLKCWGRNTAGQLGIGTTGDTGTPTLVQINSTVTDVDAAGKAMCAIDGEQGLWCTGDGDYGQIGNGSFEMTNTPLQVLVVKPTQLAASAFGACAITENNALSCWGSVYPGDGTLGSYSFPHDSPVPDLTKLTGDYYSFCGIANGGALCWGENKAGELGRGTRGLAFEPQSLGIATPTALAVGEDHGCAITGGTVQCWGNNSHGEAGNSESLVRVITPTPVMMPPTLTSPQFLAADSHKTCAWGGGEAACWGRAYYGGLATGTGARATPPTRVLRSDILDGEHAIGIGKYHLCLVNDQFQVWCYGRNDTYQLGDGTTTERQSGTTAAVLTSADQVAAGYGHTCARTTTGDIYCWGANNLGQIGDNTTTVVTSPKLVTVNNVTKIGVGDDHSCALNAANEVYCWGGNYDGQVGNGQTVFVTSPVKVVASGATDLVVGARNTCAKVAGVWQCWGRNVEGQLATGSDDPLTAPAPIAAFAGATTVAPGGAIACMMTASDIACAGDVAAIGTGDNSAALPKAPMLPSCQ